MNTKESNNDAMTLARQLAAQCWCDAETSGIEMDDRLAESFAKRIAEKINSIHELINAGDVIYNLLNPSSASMRTSEIDNALQGWDDAKIKS